MYDLHDKPDVTHSKHWVLKSGMTYLQLAKPPASK